MPRLKPTAGARHEGLRTLAMLVFASLIIITIYAREGVTGPMHTMRSAVQTIAMPFQKVGSQIARPIDALTSTVRDATASSETLSQLEQENAALTEQLAQVREYQAENERLEALVGLASAYSLNGTAARVIATSTQDWQDTITIDKGALAGIKVDMPVTIGSGVIGQIVSVSASSSTVRLLSDPEMGVSAMLQDSRETGVLSGSVDGTLHLEYVSSDVEVSRGEIVVTSGLGGAYPKGLPLGVVSSVATSGSGQYREITVEPVAKPANYEEVFVITSYNADNDGTDLAPGFVASAYQSSEASAAQTDTDTDTVDTSSPQESESSDE